MLIGGMDMKKLLLACLFGCTLFYTIGHNSSTSLAFSDNLTHHTAVSGESYWSIANNNDFNFFDVLKLNNKTQSSVLNVGDTVLLPIFNIHSFDVHNVTKGDSFYKISKVYDVPFSELLRINNADYSSMLDVGDVVILPKKTNTPKNSTNFIQYTVRLGDTLWNIANEHGVPFSEVLAANGLTETSTLSVGTTLLIPVHVIPKKGDIEFLDWYTEANYVLPVNSVFLVTDYYTQKSFYMKRTTGSCHADCEPLTSSDTQIIKEIWGGSFSWDARPILINYNGRTLAASMASFPHAGVDVVAGGVYADNRSGNYGYGYNFDWVKNNNCDGVMDIHFLNSTKHSDGSIDKYHQSNINTLKKALS